MLRLCRHTIPFTGNTSLVKMWKARCKKKNDKSITEKKYTEAPDHPNPATFTRTKTTQRHKATPPTTIVQPRRAVMIAPRSACPQLSTHPPSKEKGTSPSGETLGRQLPLCLPRLLLWGVQPAVLGDIERSLHDLYLYIASRPAVRLATRKAHNNMLRVCGRVVALGLVTLLQRVFALIGDRPIKAQVPITLLILHAASHSCFRLDLDMRTTNNGLDCVDQLWICEYILPVACRICTGVLYQPAQNCTGCWMIYSNRNTEVKYER